MLETLSQTSPIISFIFYHILSAITFTSDNSNRLIDRIVSVTRSMSNRLSHGNASLSSIFDVPTIKREPLQQLDVRSSAVPLDNMHESLDVKVVWHGAHPHTKEQVRVNGGCLSPDAKNIEPSTSVHANNSVNTK